jgi:hypothetical protein
VSATVLNSSIVFIVSALRVATVASAVGLRLSASAALRGERFFFVFISA